MKKKFIAILFMALLITIASITPIKAQPPMSTHSITFKWDKNPDVDPTNGAHTTGYNIYYSHNPDNLLPDIFDYGAETSTKINKNDILQPSPDETAVTYTWQNVPEGDYYFVCTAHNENGTESAPSNIVHKLVDYNSPIAPGNFKILITVTVNN